MSLVGALNTARTGLNASQIGLEVTGNNLANAATEGYSRQSAQTAATQGQQVGPGAFVGTGVRLQQIVRHVDEALNTRLRSATSDQNAAQAREQILSQIESVENELSDQGLSQRLTRMLDAFSEVAGNPTDEGLRSVAIAEGRSLAEHVRNLRSGLGDIRQQTDDSIRSAVERADELLDRVASLNRRIVRAEAGQGGANSLRDQRDKALGQLSEQLDITTVEQENSGAVEVFADSTPLVLGQRSRGLELKTESENDRLQIKVRAEEDGTVLESGGGRIGQLIESREKDVQNAIDTLDQFAAGLIQGMNRLHSSGQGERGFGSLTAATAAVDPSAALDSEAAGLPFKPENGSFILHVTQRSTGQRTSEQIEIDLDGLGSDTSLNGLASEIDAVNNVSASVTPSGRLEINTDSDDFRVSFSEDSSGALAALGLNTFFTGSTAADIGMNKAVAEDPMRLAVRKDHTPGDNRTATAIANLGDKPQEALGGSSLKGLWSRHVEDYANRTQQASERVEAAEQVTEGLKTQRESVSGVNVDEEAIDMMAYQRAFQGSARFINVVDELMQTMLNLVQ